MPADYFWQTGTDLPTVNFTGRPVYKNIYSPFLSGEFSLISKIAPFLLLTNYSVSDKLYLLTE